MRDVRCDRYELPACPVETALMVALTQHLRIMEENGLVHREVYAEAPPRVKYSLTETDKKDLEL